MVTWYGRVTGIFGCQWHRLRCRVFVVDRVVRATCGHPLLLMGMGVVHIWVGEWSGGGGRQVWWFAGRWWMGGGWMLGWGVVWSGRFGLR